MFRVNYSANFAAPRYFQHRRTEFVAFPLNFNAAFSYWFELYFPSNKELLPRVKRLTSFGGVREGFLVLKFDDSVFCYSYLQRLNSEVLSVRFHSILSKNFKFTHRFKLYFSVAALQQLYFAVRLRSVC